MKRECGDLSVRWSWFVTNETCSGTYKSDLEKLDNQIWPRPIKTTDFGIQRNLA